MYLFLAMGRGKASASRAAAYVWKADDQHDQKWPGWTNENMRIITEMPVRALITSPARCGATPSRTIKLAGKAWSGAGDVARVDLSFDHGLTWTRATSLSAPANKWAWQTWNATVTVPTSGTWQIFARATDVTGATQPMIAPYWNPKGYQNNAVMDLKIVVKSNANTSTP